MHVYHVRYYRMIYNEISRFSIQPALRRLRNPISSLYARARDLSTRAKSPNPSAGIAYDSKILDGNFNSDIFPIKPPGPRISAGTTGTSPCRRIVPFWGPGPCDADRPSFLAKREMRWDRCRSERTSLSISDRDLPCRMTISLYKQKIWGRCNSTIRYSWQGNIGLGFPLWSGSDVSELALDLILIRGNRGNDLAIAFAYLTSRLFLRNIPSRMCINAVSRQGLSESWKRISNE